MRVSRSVLFGAVVFVAGTPASFVATTILLDFAPEAVVWSAINYPASFLRMPLTLFMLAAAVFATLTILRVRSGDRNTIRTVPDAAMYFHAIAIVYVTIALATPYFDTLSYEPALYAPFAIALLTAAFAARPTGRSDDGRDSESHSATNSQQGRAVMLASLAAALAIGSSVAYGLQLLDGDTAGCARSYCSTEATIGFVVVMAAGAGCGVRHDAAGRLRRRFRHEASGPWRDGVRVSHPIDCTIGGVSGYAVLRVRARVVLRAVRTGAADQHFAKSGRDGRAGARTGAEPAAGRADIEWAAAQVPRSPRGRRGNGRGLNHCATALRSP